MCAKEQRHHWKIILYWSTSFTLSDGWNYLILTILLFSLTNDNFQCNNGNGKLPENLANLFSLHSTYGQALVILLPLEDSTCVARNYMHLFPHIVNLWQPWQRWSENTKTVLFQESSVFWNTTPWSPPKDNQSFGGKCRLHLQGERINFKDIIHS
jgi:hypothetical protein